jgi:hypothetical protein
MTHDASQAGRLRSPHGAVLEYPDLPTVQEWIVVGRVSRGFEIYDSQQRRWRCVEDLSDLAPFFALVDASAPWERAHEQRLRIGALE